MYITIYSSHSPVQGTVPVPLETEPYLLASEYQELRAGAEDPMALECPFLYGNSWENPGKIIGKP